MYNSRIVHLHDQFMLPFCHGRDHHIKWCERIIVMAHMIPVNYNIGSMGNSPENDTDILFGIERETLTEPAFTSVTFQPWKAFPY